MSLGEVSDFSNKVWGMFGSQNQNVITIRLHHDSIPILMLNASWWVNSMTAIWPCRSEGYESSFWFKWLRANWVFSLKLKSSITWIRTSFRALFSFFLQIPLKKPSPFPKNINSILFSPRNQEFKFPNLKNLQESIKNSIFLSI